MISFSRLLLVGACAMSLQSAAFATGHATSSDAQAMLNNAVAELNTAGSAKALAEFNQKSGPFNTGELYVFVFSMKGVYEAYGADPSMVGKDVHAMVDAEGKPVVQEILTLANTTGHGKVKYVWLNRENNRVEHKWSLIQRIGDHIVGVGYYPR